MEAPAFPPGNHTKQTHLMLEIWRLRILQKRSLAQQLFDKLPRNELVLPSDKLLHALLLVSFLRANGQLDEADQLLLHEEKNKYFLPSKYYHQKGLQEIVRLKYAAALENFILAAEFADCLFDRILAESGILSCLYHISKPCLKKLKILDRLLLECDDEELVAYIKSFIQHWSIRAYFGDGQTQRALDYDTQQGTQSHYLQLWIRSLPYLEEDKKISQSALSAFLAQQDFHLKSVRMTTLSGDLKFDSNFKTSNMSEYIDRLYLWLWDWLLKPNENHFYLLNTVLEQVLACAEDSTSLLQQRDEDLDILETCLKWCSLFDDLFAQRVLPLQKILTNLKKSSNPRLDFEKSLIQDLQERKKSKLKKKKLFASDHRIFQSNPELWSKHFQTLNDHILLQKRRSDASIIVDPAKGRLKVNKEVYHSDILARAVHLAFQNESCRFADFFLYVFRFKVYSSEDHSQKIHNLINRIKKIFRGKLQMKTRDEVIFFTLSPSLKRSAVLRGDTHHFKALQESFTFNAQTTRKEKILRTLTPQIVLNKSRGQTRFKRQELEKVLGLSKASTQRWIQKWESDGIIRRSGQGKSSFYTISLGDRTGDRK